MELKLDLVKVRCWVVVKVIELDYLSGAQLVYVMDSVMEFESGFR